MQAKAKYCNKDDPSAAVVQTEIRRRMMSFRFFLFREPIFSLVLGSFIRKLQVFPAPGCANVLIGVWSNEYRFVSVGWIRLYSSVANHYSVCGQSALVLAEILLLVGPAMIMTVWQHIVRENMFFIKRLRVPTIQSSASNSLHSSISGGLQQQGKRLAAQR